MSPRLALGGGGAISAGLSSCGLGAGDCPAAGAIPAATNTTVASKAARAHPLANIMCPHLKPGDDPHRTTSQPDQSTGDTLQAAANTPHPIRSGRVTVRNKPTALAQGQSVPLRATLHVIEESSIAPNTQK